MSQSGIRICLSHFPKRQALLECNVVFSFKDGHCVKRIWKLSSGTTYWKIQRQSESNWYINERTLKTYHSLKREIYIISYLLGRKLMHDYL